MTMRARESSARKNDFLNILKVRRRRARAAREGNVGISRVDCREGRSSVRAKSSIKMGSLC